MGAPGSCGQLVLVLRNAQLSETSVTSDRDPGPSHRCEPDERGELCNMVNECGWLRRWRAAQVEKAAPRPPARPTDEQLERGRRLIAEIASAPWPPPARAGGGTK